MRTTFLTLAALGGIAAASAAAAQEHSGCLGAAARDALASTTQTAAPLPQPIATPGEAQG